MEKSPKQHMKNRAKCKLCKDTIESFHATDFISCKCGEISLDGGQALLCFANDFANFLRVDDQGNEIVVTMKDGGKKEPPPPEEKLTLKEQLEMLERMIQSYENLPSHAMQEPITHYDFCSALMLVLSILKEKKK